MKSDCYPIEHHFLNKTSFAGDFYSQVKSIFLTDNMGFCSSLAEDIESLSKSFKSSTTKTLLKSLDHNTLNYVIEQSFLERYRSVNKYLKNIDPITFESLCSFYLSLLGCDNIRITRRSSDQGIDFYGILPHEKDQFFSPNTEKNYLIGQAKLYTAKVGTGEIREFIGSIELIKLRVSSGRRYSYKIASDIKYFTLISPIFISSSSFTRDALEIANKVGIKTVNIVQFITLLTSVDDIFDASNDLVSTSMASKLDCIKMAEN